MTQRVARLDERLAAMPKPSLQPTSRLILSPDDCLVVCSGFEERALAALQNAASISSGFGVLAIDYQPYIKENRKNAIEAIGKEANLRMAEISYDRENPAGFGERFLEILAGTRGRLFLDVSAMSRLLIVQSIVALRNRANGLGECVIVYAEANDYPPSDTEVEQAIRQSEEDPLASLLLLSSGVFDITIVPELSSTTMAGSQARLIAFPTFSPDQLTALRNELAPSRSTFIHGIPPRAENGWRTDKIAQINRLDLSSPDSVRTSTLDYRETLDCLLHLYSLHSERERLLISPTGSKMQAVAVGLLRAFIDDVQIVYPTPKEFRSPDNYTKGVRQLYYLPLAEFSSVMG